MTEYNIEELLGVIDFEKNKFQTTKQNLFLTNYEIAVLKNIILIMTIVKQPKKFYKE